MKKIFTLLFAVAAMAFVVSGCSAPAEGGDAAKPAAGAEEKKPAEGE